MDGYTLLPRMGYTVVYLLAAVTLGVSAIGTFLGIFSAGSIVWWPTAALLVLVLGLEVHSFYNRRLA